MTGLDRMATGSTPASPRPATLGEPARPDLGEPARPDLGESARPDLGESVRPDLGESAIPLPPEKGRGMAQLSPLSKEARTDAARKAIEELKALTSG